MPDEMQDEKLEEERERRNKRLARTRRELRQFLDRATIPLLIGGFLGMLAMFPVGLALMSTFLLTHVAIIALTVLPHTNIKLSTVLLWLLALAIPIALIVAQLGDVIELTSCVAITAWVGVLAVRLNAAITAERAKNPD